MRAASMLTTLALLLAGGRAQAAAVAAPGPATAPPPVVPVAPVAPVAPLVPDSPGATATAGSPSAPRLVRDPAPRPVPALRVQARYAEKAGRVLLYAGVEYLSRGDFFDSPGARVGAGFHVLESLALEAQVSHYWSSLNAEGQQVQRTLGAIPDSAAPAWLMLAGARYSIGYGKLLVGGMGTAIHFEPQVFMHLGGHIYDNDKGFSSDAGFGLLVFLTPRAFARIDIAMVFERERRSGVDVSVLGALPALCFGGVL